MQAMSIGQADEVVCADINPAAVEVACANSGKMPARRKRFVVSDLFENVDGTFDLIAFNAPYLDGSEPRDYAWTHVQDGRDVIERFIRESKRYVKRGGRVLLLISDRGYEKYLRCAEETGYEWNVAARMNLFFERLFVIEMKVKT